LEGTQLGALKFESDAKSEGESEERYTHKRQVKYVKDVDVTETNYTGVTSFLDPVFGRCEGTVFKKNNIKYFFL